MRVILLGRPGSGKGTQARRLAEGKHVPVISSGDLFRQAVGEGTPLGVRFKQYLDAGQLVPDSLVLAILGERLEQRDCRPGFLLDGFPRTLGQAKALEHWLSRAKTPLDATLYLVVPEGDLIERARGRRFCLGCGSSFHVAFRAPKRDGVCDSCGGNLIQRDDDRDEVVRARAEEYGEKTAPLLSFYRERGLLREIDGMGRLEEVQARIDQALAGPARGG
jgi:adenylate kinase